MDDPTIFTRAATEFVADDDTNTVVVQLAEYGTPRPVNDGAGTYREQFDSMTMADRVMVKDSHAGVIIGHADPASFRESPNPTVDLTIADTTAGRDLMALVRAGSIADVSVEFSPKSGENTEIDGVTHRSGTTINAVAFAHQGAHVAPVLAMREETDMSEPIIPDDVVRTDDLNRLRDDLTREISVTAERSDANPYADLLEFDNFGSLTQAAFRDKDLNDQLHRALSNQLTTKNPGVMLPNDVQEIKRIVETSRPTINSFGSEQLPASGMSVEFPYTDTDVSALVGVQSAEKTAITSVQIEIKQGTAAVATYSGGSDISVQLIERSSPDFLSVYMRLMTSGMACTTEAAFGAAIVAAAQAGGAAGGTAATVKAAVFEASVAVEAATGRPAEFVLASTDQFTALGAMAGLENA
ncbi:MAG: hypothetical protein P8O03_06980, partial [Ilumatobacter sp.]|nr:hypothetical protein [Ilumatobacter sp.]